MSRPSWSGFAAWALFGALALLSFVSLLSIGVFLAPLAVVCGIVAARRWPDGRHAAGLLAGLGATALLVACLNLGASPHCAADRASCEEFDIRPWLAAGAALVATGCGLFARLRASAETP